MINGLEATKQARNVAPKKLQPSMVSDKKIIDVRFANLKKHQQWEFAQANIDDKWLMTYFSYTSIAKEIIVKAPFKDWYGNWIVFMIGLDNNRELFFHDDGNYLRQLEKHHAEIYPEVKRRFFEQDEAKQIENKYDFILKRTNCKNQEAPSFTLQLQQYCLSLTHLTKIVIEVEQASKFGANYEGSSS